MQFPEIIHAAYAYVIEETAKFLQEPLISTGLAPHFGLAIDKSTPHRETNQAIVLLVPSSGKRVAVPIDAPVVYTVNPNSGDIQGGSHDELAKQVMSVLSEKLKINQKHLHFLRGLICHCFKSFFCIIQAVHFLKRYPLKISQEIKFYNQVYTCIYFYIALHADGQYHTNKFQESLYSNIGETDMAIDPFFLLSWDVSHWLDLVMVFLREEAASSQFLKRLIKRSNRFHIWNTRVLQLHWA